MAEHFDISVVITTYNRCDLLSRALDSVLRQEAAVPFEVIVVDNNSKDGTREIIESLIASSNHRLKYVFEGRQGISQGRNAGIRNASAPIIAFTDDDVRVGPGWVASIKRAFDEHPEADFVGGKILPSWKVMPPRWLTRNHWWPLALLDYGDKPFYVSADNPICLPTANVSFRREIFDRIGLFSSAFSGREDHELLVRLWRAGRKGLYMPNIVVTAEVQLDRLRKQYHHRWNITTGKFNSMMRLDDTMGPHGRLLEERADTVMLFGTPASLYRELLRASVRWVSATAQLRESLALQHENRICYLIGYISERYRNFEAENKRSSLVEISRFVKTLLRKKFMPNLPSEGPAVETAEKGGRWRSESSE
ncbi:MAG TPA: glycosyltransferase family A protein [Blastocatellia bacterium]|jgi:glycosyltransferase involved in cell wall biosynthesis